MILQSLRLMYLFLLIQLATTLPSNFTNNISLDPSLNALSSNESLGSPTASCANSAQLWPAWFQPSKKFDSGDVDKALSPFFNDYVRGHGNSKYEFLLFGVEPMHKIPTQRLPLKVGCGTCFVVIAMRSQFKKGELPLEMPTPSTLSDVDSFEDIWRGLNAIARKCSHPFGDPGWYPAGKIIGDLNSIAVSIWQAASPINKRIGPASDVIENFNLTPLDWTTGGYDEDTLACWSMWDTIDALTVWRLGRILSFEAAQRTVLQLGASNIHLRIQE